MVEPQKPFACAMPDCGMTFTNEDHLHVHTKKHDMVLQLGLEQKNAFVADQTPTPTRFIRNCEEVGLFQDLQNVTANPFDEGFKRAMETKHHGILSLEATPTNDDVLHTPQMFPLMDAAESTLYTNTQRNVTISRSSSDESSTIKEFETHTISKLTNEVTTISRIVNTHTEDVTISHTDTQKDVETIMCKNNVIKIQSNIIRKDGNREVINRDSNKLNVDDKVPIMSQKSIDFVVDSLTSELIDGNVSVTENFVLVNQEKSNAQDSNKTNEIDLSESLKAKYKQILNKEKQMKTKFPKISPKKEIDKKDCAKTDLEVMIKLPNGTLVRMKPVDDTKAEPPPPKPKVILREMIVNKVNKTPLSTPKTNKTPNVMTLPKPINNPASKVVELSSGTLIPVTLVDQAGSPLTTSDLNKVPITKIGIIKRPVANDNSNKPGSKKEEGSKTPTTPPCIRGTAATLKRVSSSDINTSETSKLTSNTITVSTSISNSSPIVTAASSNSAVTPNTVVVTPNGTIITPNGAVLTPNAPVLSSNGAFLTSNGVLTTNGTLFTSNGAVHHGTMLAANSTIVPSNMTSGTPNTSLAPTNTLNVASNGAILTPNGIIISSTAATHIPKRGSAKYNTVQLSKLQQNRNSNIKNNQSNQNSIVTGKIDCTVFDEVDISNPKNEVSMQSNAEVSHAKIHVRPSENSIFNIQISQPYQIDQGTGKRKNIVTQEDINKELLESNKKDDDCVIEDVYENPEAVKRTKMELESRCAASKRYRDRLKQAMKIQSEENKKLREANQKLIAEKAVLKLLITEHMKQCSNAKDMANLVNSINTVMKDL